MGTIIRRRRRGVFIILSDRAGVSRMSLIPYFELGC